MSQGNSFSLQYLHICVYIYIYICVCVYIYVCVCVHVYICVCIYVCVCVRVYICVCIYVCVYIYISRSTQCMIINIQIFKFHIDQIHIIENSQQIVIWQLYILSSLCRATGKDFSDSLLPFVSIWT